MQEKTTQRQRDRERYHNDPDYRRRRMESVKRYREKKRRECGGVVVERWHVCGKDVIAYTPKTAEKKLGFKPGTLRMARFKKIIPVAKLVTVGGTHLYTDAMVQTIKEAWEKWGSGYSVEKKMWLMNEWHKLGVL